MSIRSEECRMKRTKRMERRIKKMAKLPLQTKRKRSARSERRIRIRAHNLPLRPKTPQLRMQTGLRLGSNTGQTPCGRCEMNCQKVNSLLIRTRVKMKVLLTTRLEAITLFTLARSSLIATSSCKSSAGATFQPCGWPVIRCTNLMSLLKFRKVHPIIRKQLTMK